ncbi:hypothetical protein DV735_g4374, partial [Chaetothyriales sp. CBS 134920]
MAAVSVASVVEKLEGQHVKTRDEGLSDLRRLLDTHALEADDLDTLLDAIYRIVRTERPAYVSRANGRSRTVALANRLASAATALRLTVEASCPVLEYRSALSVLNHVITALPTADDSLLEPLRSDYLKCFRIVLEYGPHGEHLRPKKWQALVDFALAGLAVLADLDDDVNSSTAQDKGSGETSTISLSFRASQASSQKSSRNATGSAVEDLMAALRALTSITNAPLISRASDICDTVVSCIIAVPRAQEYALETFNNVVLMICSEDTVLLKSKIEALVRVYRQLWTWSKTTGTLREQILISLYASRAVFAAHPPALATVDYTPKQELYSTLLTEYSERSFKDMLQFDDIVIQMSDFRPPKPVSYDLVPAAHSGAAVSNWTLLEVLAILVTSLSSAPQAQEEAEEANEDLPRKRRKLDLPVHELMAHAQNGQASEKLAALQVLFFLASVDSPLCEDICQRASSLALLLSDENHNTSTWAFLLFVRVCRSKRLSSSLSQSTWRLLFDSARRAVGISAKSRAACLLLDTILQQDLDATGLDRSTLQDMFASGRRNSPAIYSDAALLMFARSFNASIFDQESTLKIAASRTLDWLGAQWHLPEALDRFHNKRLAFHAQPEYLCHLFTSMLRSHLQLRVTYHRGHGGKLLQSRAAVAQSETFVAYLESIDNVFDQTSLGQDSPVTRLQSWSSGVSFFLQSSIVDLVLDRIKGFAQAWKGYAAARRASTSGLVSIMTSAFVVARLVSSVLAPHTKQTQSLDESALDLSRLLEKSLQRGFEAEARIVASTQLLRLRDPAQRSDYPLARALGRPTGWMIEAILTHDEGEAIADDGLVDPIESHLSQSMKISQDSRDSGASRLCLTSEAFYSTTVPSLRLDLIIEFAKTDAVSLTDGRAASKIIDELVNMSSEDLIRSRVSICNFFDQQMLITRPDAARLLTHLAKKLLQEYNFERNEASLSLTIHAMTQLVPMWAATSQFDLFAESAVDIYSWLIRTILDRDIASPNVKASLSSMLHTIIQSPGSIGTGDLPSPRTSLLGILRSSPNAIKFRMSGILVGLFNRYLLTEHEAIFDDILDSLPSDLDDLEGVAIRMSFLADIGAKWSTVLRHSTYHLFETAINVPRMQYLASSCCHRLSTNLGLPSSRSLFELFSSQIIYTWLGQDTLGDSELPYAAFQYESLEDMVSKNASEMTAQVALRGSAQLKESLGHILGISWQAALKLHFGRAEAYCLASQTSLPESAQLQPGSEKALRRDIGVELYSEKLSTQIPTIIFHLLRISDDRGMERALEKNGLAEALSGYQSMSKLSNSGVVVTPGQQPFFRAKYFVDEVQWLCSQTGHQIDQLFSPSMLVFLCRKLFLIAHPTMGPLHACSVLRRIKTVVSLSGHNAFADYPLEMLLHNLNPYLTVILCSEDAIGIYWYLLHHSTIYLSAQPSFVSGLAISVFSALVTFVQSPQDSTTQESQFVATMSKAQEFRAWLGEYLSSLEVGRPAQNEFFQELIEHAKGMSGYGTNAASSQEGKVLLVLLKDRVSPAPVLTDSHFDLAIRSLCKNFILSADISDDILQSPSDCQKYCVAIKAILGRITLNEAFQTWASQVIGRACSLFGPGPGGRVLGNGSGSGSLQQDNSGNSLTGKASYESILKHVEAALWHVDLGVAATAEQTLQAIATIHTRKHSKDLVAALISCPILDTLRADVVVPGSASDDSWEDNGEVIVLDNLSNGIDNKDWCSKLAKCLCLQARSDPMLEVLCSFASATPEISAALLPYIVHLVLLQTVNGLHDLRTSLSSLFGKILVSGKLKASAAVQVVLSTVLYLRRCRLATESTFASRNGWLEIDFGQAADAAVRSRCWHAALLCLELQQAQQHLQSGRSSRRSTQTAEAPGLESLTQIYQHVDDPDFFYADHHDADLSSIIQRLAHESASKKMLSFQSAALDSVMKSGRSSSAIRTTAVATANALSAANMQGISEAVRSLTSHLSQGHQDNAGPGASVEHSDWKKEPEIDTSSTDFTLNHLRELATAAEVKTVIDEIDRGLAQGVDSAIAPESTHLAKIKGILPLAVLSEVKDFLLLGKVQGVEGVIDQMSKIRSWGQDLEFEELSGYLSCRESAIGMIRRNERLREVIGLTKVEALAVEARTACQSLQIVARHESSQFQLCRAVYLCELAKEARQNGLDMEVFSQYHLARTISTQGETTASVDMLRRLVSQQASRDLGLTVSSSEILVELGQQVSAARLEPPEEIIEKYLLPAYKELKGETQGVNAGRVFHLFANYCDSQLQDAGNRDEYSRALEKRAMKMAESWLNIYEDEYQQKHAVREALILRCLENYLRSMAACDDFGNDKLRFVAIWLDAADSSKANEIVSRYIKGTPSWKFASLVNQLVSRLADTKQDFQTILTDLIFRISSDHPYHSLYQLFAVSKSKKSDGDAVAASRYQAGVKITDNIFKRSVSSGIWVAIHNCGINFVRVAQAKLPEKKSKVLLRDIDHGLNLISSVKDSSRKIPPPSMKIDIRKDKDYSSVPTMMTIDPQVSIAGGVSAPKIATTTASDGSVHKMLLKAGNDDLRQDSIMEQVFEEVSNLLQDHRSTRQRNLGIRTYKVVPLVTNAGIIEFVQGTIPLHDYLFPAHERYFPKDYKAKHCRSEIYNAEKKPVQQRIQAYRNATARFHPVMRFFFMEYFMDPDEWFYKRLNYSRTTAAISVLGHVLGLGDRHGHNILLDKHTGEVVHIDLGVAFEAGRILPVPEVVPFRLTRDLVDGMGISGVEGPFRRCCNFTLEALRRDQESIMTLLDVLRYDPLVSWSISPHRIKKMQEAADAAETARPEEGKAVEAAMMGLVGNRPADEPNEADRALSVVREKLGRSLSVEAEVNELIRQATDERNLAVLFAGWGAYA